MYARRFKPPVNTGHTFGVPLQGKLGGVPRAPCCARRHERVDQRIQPPALATFLRALQAVELRDCLRRKLLAPLGEGLARTITFLRMLCLLKFVSDSRSMPSYEGMQHEALSNLQDKHIPRFPYLRTKVCQPRQVQTSNNNNVCFTLAYASCSGARTLSLTRS